MIQLRDIVGHGYGICDYGGSETAIRKEVAICL